MGFENQRIKFLDVGHGDSTVIYLRNTQSDRFNVVVIDVADGDKLIKELVENEIKVIDLLIISHSDADHCKGINDFLEKFMQIGVVKEVCYNIDRVKTTKTMRLFLKKFMELHYRQQIDLVNGVNTTSVHKKELISNSKSRLFLLYPNMAENTEAYVEGNTNNMSIVCMLENETCNIIFPGDLQENGWKKLMERLPDLRCDVLKMPHHGAFYDGTKGLALERILEVLKPCVTIVSAGNHQLYQHPARQTIELLKDKKIKVYCTQFTSLCHHNLEDFQRKCYGDIEVIITDDDYKIKTEVTNFSLLSCVGCNG